MKTTVLWLSCFLTLFLLNEVKAQVEMNKTKRGAKYKIIRGGGFKNQIKVGDIVRLQMVEKTAADSVLFSSYGQFPPLTVEIHPSKNISDLMDVFLLLYEKDSAVITIPSDSILKGTEHIRPSYLPPGSELTFFIKIEKVQTEAEVLAEERQAIEAEQVILRKYIIDRKLKPIFTASGLLYLATKKTNTFRPEPGDTVIINYTATTLDGKVFDTSIAAEAKKAGLADVDHTFEPVRFVVGEGNILSAWDEGLLLMNEGTRATFILTSNLAYGAAGYKSQVKPYSTILMNVTLVKIIKGSVDNKVQGNGKVNSGVFIEQGDHSDQLIGGLTSLLVLINKKKASHSNNRIFNSPTAGTPWAMQWLNVITKSLGY